LAAIIDLPLSSIESFLNHALEKEIDQTLFKVWLAAYPLMLTEKIENMTFDEFKSMNKKKHSVSNKSVKEIEDEMDKIITAYEKAVK